MTKIAVGDSVRFRPGTVDVDLDVDIGGWQGRVVKFTDADLVMVAFDSITLRSMPGEYIESCEERGLDWSEYGAALSELEVVASRDTPADVRSAVAELNARFPYSHLGPEGKELNAVLAGVDPEDEMAVMERWGAYLGQALTFPFEAEVADLLYERGPIRYGDRLRVLRINMVDESYGVLVDVKRGRKSYVHPLCDLEPVDDRSSNCDPLQHNCTEFGLPIDESAAKSPASLSGTWLPLRGCISLCWRRTRKCRGLHCMPAPNDQPAKSPALHLP